MTMGTKELIAKAVTRLLMEKRVKRLTVTDIVEECHITRQTFYYHFEDIPDVMRWIGDYCTEAIMEECIEKGTVEEALRYLILLTQNMRPLLEAGMNSNYRDDLAKIFIKQFYHFFSMIIEHESLYQNCSETELKVLQNYHCNGMMGILMNWTDADTENIDEIVQAILKILRGDLKPF